jgi:nucleotide-binding universal stress UspA family protein
MSPIRTILHPTDFSVYSQWAFRLAVAIARDQGAGLIVLHVVPNSVSIGEPKTARDPEFAAHRHRELTKYHEVMKERWRHLQVPDGEVAVEYLFCEGDAADVILRITDEKGCDLVVLGTRGTKGTERLILGNVAEEVSRKAQCPVVTVRLPAEHIPGGANAESDVSCQT